MSDDAFTTGEKVIRRVDVGVDDAEVGTIVSRLPDSISVKDYYLVKWGRRRPTSEWAPSLTLAWKPRQRV